MSGKPLTELSHLKKNKKKSNLKARVSDTSVENDPSAGLMIYNLNSKTPEFHNGNAWTALAGAAVASPNDSIVYNISGPGSSGFTTGNSLAENYTLEFTNIGFKDWTNDLSF